MKRMKCPDCGHHRTTHYDPLTQGDSDVQCRAVDQQRKRICNCTRTRDDILRAFVEVHTQ